MTERKRYKPDYEQIARQLIAFFSRKTDKYVESHGLGNRQEEIAKAEGYLRTGAWPERAQREAQSVVPRTRG